MIPICWHAQESTRGIYNCTAQLNSMFDLYDCKHFACRDMMPMVEGAVMMIHGGREPNDLDRLNRDIEKLKWVLLIHYGDEAAEFPAELVEHDNRIVWVQEPLPGKHDFADRFILDGWTPHTKELVAKWGHLEKGYDFVFAGQITHERRRACRDALQKINWGGVIVESKGYCQGVSLEEYHRLLCQAKIIPCPSGPRSPDSARVCEALECRAIPILDDLSPTRKEQGFWEMVLGVDHPLPVIQNWSALPLMIEMLKDNWAEKEASIHAWWKAYVSDFNTWLGQDIEALCTKTRSQL